MSYQGGPEGMPTAPTSYYGPHATGGPVGPMPHQQSTGGPGAAPAGGGQDVRYSPPPQHQAAPPGVPQQMPRTGLRGTGMATPKPVGAAGGNTHLAHGGHYEVPMSPHNGRSVG